MTLDDELVRALQEDYQTAPISEQDKVMLDYVSQLTRDATRMGGSLCGNGFDDKSILQVTLIASWLFDDRVADALGVGRD